MQKTEEMDIRFSNYTNTVKFWCADYLHILVEKLKRKDINIVLLYILIVVSLAAEVLVPEYAILTIYKERTQTHKKYFMC